MSNEFQLLVESNEECHKMFDSNGALVGYIEHVGNDSRGHPIYRCKDGNGYVIISSTKNFMKCVTRLYNNFIDC